MPKPHFTPLNDSQSDNSGDMYQDNFRPEHSESHARSNDEEQRFYSLAKEALVATAASTSQNKILDPTINDLLTRLQYVSSPHGNPIKHGENIKVNDNGQLMIQDFYASFPNMNNDIFAAPANGASPLAVSNQGASAGPHLASGASAAFRPAIASTNMGANLSMSALNNTTPTLSPSDDWYEDNTRKFQCSKCSMSFRRSSDLKRHEKQHLTIPPNICEYCGKGFARKDALKRHVGTATCKRNSEKQLYAENLEYLRKKSSA